MAVFRRGKSIGITLNFRGEEFKSPLDSGTRRPLSEQRRNARRIC